MKPKEVLQDPKAPATALLSIVMKRYGNEVLHFDPAVLRHDIEQDFGVELTDQQADKLQAALVLMGTDHFENNLEVFELVCHLFTGGHNTFEDWEPLETEEVICGTCEATLIRHEKLDYSDDVRRYVGEVFLEDGFFNPPELFPTALMPVKLPAEEVALNEGVEKEKNEALRELFNSRLAQIVEYVNNVEMGEIS